MLGLELRTDHSNGSFRLEVWRDKDSDICLTVYDAKGGPQFDFALTEGEARDFAFLLERAITEKPRDQE